MHVLRQSRHIASLVLIWFVCFWCTALATIALPPPAGSTDICTTGGMFTLQDAGEVQGGAGAGKALTCMDCPLCTALPAPTAPAPSHFSRVPPLAYALRPGARAYVAAVTAPPLPSRGPPLAGDLFKQLLSHSL